MSESTLSNSHWVYEDYNEVVTVKTWREHALKYGIHPMVKGRLRTFQAKLVGGGLMEVSKVPLKEAPDGAPR